MGLFSDTTAYDALFQDAGQRWSAGSGLDPATFAALLKAHAKVESQLNPRAFRREPGGRASRGLMQVLDTTAYALGYAGTLGDDRTRTGGLYDPAVSIPLAAQLVSQNLIGAGGNLDVAIAAYNEGLGRAQADAAAGTPWRTTDPNYVGKVRQAVTDYLPALSDDSGAATATGNGVTTVSIGAGLGLAALVSALVWALLRAFRHTRVVP